LNAETQKVLQDYVVASRSVRLVKGKLGNCGIT